MAPEIANPAPSLNPTKFSIRPSLRPTIPSSDGLGKGCPGLRHERSDEVEGRDAAPAAMSRNCAATRQRSDDSTDKDDREQLVYRRTRQPGALRQGARLTEESAAGSRPLFSICRRRVDSLAPQAHDHVNANDLVARRWHGNCTDRNIITASTNARADIVRWPVAECAQVSMQVWPMATSRFASLKTAIPSCFQGMISSGA